MNSAQISQNFNNRNQVPVYLNVYNFSSCFNKIFDPLGIGLYHTGVQIFGDQYMFFGFNGDDTGVGYIEPYQAAYEFKQQILLGYTPLSFFDFDDKVLDPLRIQFTGSSYDLLGKNCNHFAKRLTKQLKVDDKFPDKIFRVTDFCNLFRCCIPQCILNGRLDWLYPPEQSQKSSHNGYSELQESVKDQIDMKMLSQKQKLISVQQKMSPYDKKDTVTTPTIEPQKIMQNQKSSQQSLHHHEAPKNTTVALRKGILPHLQNAHERASFNELPIQSPIILGTEKLKFEQGITPKVQQYHQRYPKEDVKMFRPEISKKEANSES